MSTYHNLCSPGDKPIKVDVSSIHNDVQLVSPLGVRLTHLYLLIIMLMVCGSGFIVMMKMMKMTIGIIVCTSTVAEVLSLAATAESIVAFTGPYGLSFTFRSSSLGDQA